MTYRCIAVDPPWPQKGGGTLRGREGWHDSHGASLPMKYLTMSVAEIAAMPVRDLREGWDVWGDQAPNAIEIAGLRDAS